MLGTWGMEGWPHDTMPSDRDRSARLEPAGCGSRDSAPYRHGRTRHARNQRGGGPRYTVPP